MNDQDNPFKEPYDVIIKKLELANLSLRLGEVTRTKWEKLGMMKDILREEEDLIRQIAERTAELSGAKDSEAHKSYPPGSDK